MSFKSSFKTPLLVLIAFSLLNLSACQTFTAQATTACKNVDVLSWQMTDAERLAKRASTQTPVYIPTDGISDLLNSSGYSKAVKGLIAYFVVILILLLFTLVTFFVFFAFCCCCRRYKSPSQKKTKISWFISLFFFIGFTVLLILMIIFLANTNKQYSSIKCTIAKIPADLLEGNTDDSIKFMGFETLSAQLNALKTEVGGFENIAADFTAIINRDIDTKSTSAAAALPIFYNQYKDRTTRNGSGTAAKPTSVSSLTQNVSDAIDTEFTLYVYIGTALNNVAENGNKFISNDSQAAISEALDNVVDFLNTLISPLKTQMTSINSSMNSVSKFIPIGTYVALGLGLLILFLAAVFIVVLCCRFSKQRCLKGSCCLKTVLIVLSLLSILLTLISILLLITTTGVSTFCRITGELLAAPQVSTVLAKYGITFKDETINNAIDRCVSLGATGDIASLVGADGTSSEYIQYIADFLDGINNFEQQLDTVKTGAVDSTTVLAQTAVWANIQVGLAFDHSDVTSALANLNSLISCGGTKFVMNIAACSSTDTNCQAISSTASFTAPACSSDAATANTTFVNLKNYYNDENALMGSMITDLGSTTADTANNRFRTSKQAMRDSETNFDNITNQLTNTLAAVSSFNEDFTTLSDCRIIRREIENFETVFCFQTGRHIYLFFCFTVFAAFCLFILTWFLCATMRCIANQDGGDVHPRDHDMFDNTKERGYFNDEKVPL